MKAGAPELEEGHKNTRTKAMVRWRGGQLQTGEGGGEGPGWVASRHICLTKHAKTWASFPATQGQTR